jgi:copper chaperone
MTTYIVAGMTCDHCVHTVTGEVSKVAGVESVQVDLASGRLTVSGEGFVDEQVRAAIDEAGYELVDTSAA